MDRLAAAAPRRLILNTETLLRGTLVLMFGLSSVSFIEPSPYEFFFFLLIPIALIRGLIVTRVTILLFLLLTIAVVAELLALMPHLGDGLVDAELPPTMYTVYTTYLDGSAFLFALIFSQHTSQRVGLCLKAYAFSCVFAGAWGILSYLNIAGIGDLEPIAGRVAGPFKDPNVLGSFSVLGVLYLVQSVIIGTKDFRVMAAAGAAIALFGGVFLSFSRGSWGAMVVSAALLGIMTYVTADTPAMRRKIIQGLFGIVGLICIGGAAIASNDTLRDTFTQRAQLEQEYDGGVTGRFGNQKRSIPMLLEQPLGFGPHRFALYFHLDPHNSYIGAFASGGWIGGFCFLFIVLSTSTLAIRLCLIRSPYRRHAQVVAPAIVTLFLQGLQIDIDHWRFLFLMLGAVWGMEAARIRLRHAPARFASAQPTPNLALP